MLHSINLLLAGEPLRCNIQTNKIYRSNKPTRHRPIKPCIRASIADSIVYEPADKASEYYVYASDMNPVVGNRGRGLYMAGDTFYWREINMEANKVYLKDEREH